MSSINHGDQWSLDVAGRPYSFLEFIPSIEQLPGKGKALFILYQQGERKRPMPAIFT